LEPLVVPFANGNPRDQQECATAYPPSSPDNATQSQGCALASAFTPHSRAPMMARRESKNQTIRMSDDGEGRKTCARPR
jgi:hypothetical protein